MADAIPCVNCGWSETSHTEHPYRGDEDDPTGFKHSLMSCPGFVPEPITLGLILEERRVHSAWMEIVYSGRESAGQAIWEKIIEPLQRGERSFFI